MKKICLSVATIVALSTTLFSAEAEVKKTSPVTSKSIGGKSVKPSEIPVATSYSTLSEALVNGKFSGSARIVAGIGNNSDVVAIGAAKRNAQNASAALDLGYVTADFNGFKFGVVGQAGWDLGLHEGDTATGEDNMQNTVTESGFREVYIDYGFRKSNLTIGRQVLELPLIYDGRPYALRDSFDAANLSFREIDKTLLQFAYIKKWNKIFGDDATNIKEEDIDYDRGMYTLYVKNNSFAPLTIDAQYLTHDQEGPTGDVPISVEDGFDTYFARASYKLPFSHPLSVTFAYAGADYDTSPKAGNDKNNVDVYDFRVNTKIGDVGLMLGYTTVSEDNDWIGAVGLASEVILSTNTLNNKTMYAGVDAYGIQAMYKFTPKLNVRAKYVHYDQSEEGVKHSTKNLGQADVIDLDIRYDLSSILKGLSTRANMSYAKHAGDYTKATDGGEGNMQTYGRYYLIYNF